MSFSLFVLSALRAVVEMLGLCLLGQAALALLAGRSRLGNPIYRLFALITRAPRRLCGKLLPGTRRPWLEGELCFLLLLLAWIALAVGRLFVLQGEA